MSKLNENTITLLVNTGLSVAVKGGSLLVSFFSTPAFIAYFDNNAVLGVWFTMLSVLSWILSFDMGVGNGLRNYLVEALNDSDMDDVRRLISSSYFSLGSISIVVFIAVWLLSGVIDWRAILNIGIDEISTGELNASVMVVLASICIQMVLRLVSSVLYALQRAFVPSLLALITNCVMLCFAVISNSMEAEFGLFEMSAAYFFAVNLPLLVASVYMFVAVLPSARPSIKYFNVAYACKTVKLGVAFLWLQAMALVLNSTGSLLVSLLVSSDAVVEYQIYYKVFTLLYSAIAIALTPIWSAATKAKVSGDFTWLYRIYKRYMAIGLVLALVNFGICYPAQSIFDIWLGSATIPVSPENSLVFAAYGSILVFSSILTSFANGVGELKTQTVLLTIAAFVNIPLAVLLVHLGVGYIGVVLANTLAYIPYVSVLAMWLFAYLRKQTRD